ncbi:Oidioi.mRNA.OKI2018_I69.PAR.g9431.t1.cds [Oikopleura dioica]|uniref:Oidioi.mRNA.OKI2018_I69.PAR.g9431.t1.cds n=1 Tax=Oikopleura dioica TaxID=34765 RepID=A0ABN7RT47_OIKDI|nr:Oidioi.mRNA.OKI2018_I69.PAR.g9431.t1.cds [Oikopleura dioica]
MNSKLYFPYDAPECYLKEAEICLWLTFCLIVLGEVQDQFLKRIWSGAESKAQRFCSAHGISATIFWLPVYWVWSPINDRHLRRLLEEDQRLSRCRSATTSSS